MMTSDFIPFNRPYPTGKEHGYIQEALESLRYLRRWTLQQTLSRMDRAAHRLREGIADALLHLGPRHCRDAARPQERRRGDHALVHLRLDRERVRAARRDPGLRRHPRQTRSTSTNARSRPRSRRARARSSPVHYAGVGCEMDAIIAIAERHDLSVVEDAAQGILATYKGRPLGSHRRISAAFSFHETKNIISGEGGALLVNDPRFVRARRDHAREGHQPQPVLPRRGRQVHLGRHRLLLSAERYHRRVSLGPARGGRAHHTRAAGELEQISRDAGADGAARPPAPSHRAKPLPPQWTSLLRAAATEIDRSMVLGKLKDANISAVFHYVPLHSSPAGQRFGRTHGDLADDNRALGTSDPTADVDGFAGGPAGTGLRHARERSSDGNAQSPSDSPFFGVARGTKGANDVIGRGRHRQLAAARPRAQPRLRAGRQARSSRPAAAAPAPRCDRPA